MSLKVLDPGPLTTVQDAGRTGYAAQGYRVCGAADSYAYRLGNMLIGNAPGAAVLECTLRGAALQFETDTVFALTGAVSPAALDGVPVPYYAPLFAKAGSTLQMGMASTGLRSYLAVGGGIALHPAAQGLIGAGAVDIRLPAAQQIQVRPIDDEKFHTCSLHMAAMTSAAACAVSSRMA